jgi:esterase/lipase superfamily enzyme
LLFLELDFFGRHPCGRLWKKLVALGGPKYKARGFEHLLSKFFDDDLYLDSTLTLVLIPAFDIKLQQPVFFSSWKVKKESLPSFPHPQPTPDATNKQLIA